MKKANYNDYLNLLNDFKKEHNINDITYQNFDYYAALKFTNETFMKGLYDFSLVKTNNEGYPILLKNYSKLIYKEDDSNIFKNMDRDVASSIEYVPVIQESDFDYLNKIYKALNDSKGFKEFITNFELAFHDDLDLVKLKSDLQKLPAFRFVEEFRNLDSVVAEKEERSSSVRTGLDNVISVIQANTHLLKQFRIYNLFDLYNDYSFSFESSRPDAIRTHDEMMDKYYTVFDEAFEPFKRRQCMKLGMLLNSKTEQQLLDTPELNKFVQLVKDSYPDWFTSIDDITCTVTDDNTIRASGVELQHSFTDFELFDVGYIGSARPALTEGYSYMPKHYINNTKDNHVHISGDNSFFKVYYHHLMLEKKGSLTLCSDVESVISMEVDRSKYKDHIRPVLDYFEKNNIVMNLNRESSIFRYVEEKEMADLIKSDYPKLIHTLNVTNFVHLIELSEATSLKEANQIYEKINESVKQKELSTPLKHKI